MEALSNSLEARTDASQTVVVVVIVYVESIWKSLDPIYSITQDNNKDTHMYRASNRLMPTNMHVT